MYPHHHRKRHSAFASCLVATVFLLILLLASAVVLFLLFKPQDPQISLNSVQFPSFSLSNSSTFLNFTLLESLSIRNPNRYSFSHYDSSLQLYVSGTQLGSMFIPAGEIGPGGTQWVEATFVVARQLSGGGGGLGTSVGIEIEMRMKLVGNVRVLKVFAHHVVIEGRCGVTVLATDGSVLGYHC